MESYKRCTECDLLKSHSEFHKRAASKDGLSPRCKSCCKIYDKNRANLEHRVIARKLYQESEGGKIRSCLAKKRYIEKNPKKRSAHVKVGNALRDGILIKMPCVICGDADVQAHHCNYNFPLDVMWLCVKHHVEWHRENDPIV